MSDGFLSHALEPKTLKYETLGLFPISASNGVTHPLTCEVIVSISKKHGSLLHPIYMVEYPLLQEGRWPSLSMNGYSSHLHHFVVVCMGLNVASEYLSKHTTVETFF